ncbi:MAG: choice-of-anchor J domain-containing protein [Candidatus Chryseobacterium colombiense]|nr:choice-of-anchor J domain-containing protein [Chryseobacterium sp.]WEK68979.1 MAG: choice-of-anchor J domain-containing protein [Chryseobacterium sp.]
MKQQLLFFLLACGILSNAQVFSENFNGGSMPAGWTVNNPDTAFNWGVGGQSGFATFPSGAAFFDDDNAGSSSINSNARLVSPVINLVGVASPKLSFKYANMIYDLDSTIKVEVFNGTSWVQVFSSSGDSGQWELIGIRLCTQLMLMKMLQILI